MFTVHLLELIVFFIVTLIIISYIFYLFQPASVGFHLEKLKCILSWRW